eukprot:COSAG02_NODE_50346_length_321_cov_0.693694_1_plen_21_part_10
MGGGGKADGKEENDEGASGIE